MKTKLLFTGILSATLLLGACGNDESKTEDKKETVKTDADKQKDKKQKEAREKQEKEKREKKEKAKKDEQQDQSVEQTQQTNEQVTDEQQTVQEPTQEPTQEQQAEPTEQEKTKANAEWAKENVQGGTDAGMLDPSMQPDGYYSNDRLDPETGLPKDDAVPHKVGEIYNPAREQVIDEGIDMDNPTDAEIERMRELAKDSPHGLQTSPSQGGY